MIKVGYECWGWRLGPVRHPTRVK